MATRRQVTTPSKSAKTPPRGLAPRRRRRRWVWYALAALIGPSLIIIGVMAYYYVTLSRIIEQRLHGEQTRVFPRVFARPLELHRGQGLTDRQLIDRLNDLGYTQRAAVERPGEFAIGRNAVALMVRGGKSDGEIIRVIFDQAQPTKGKPNPRAPFIIKALERPSDRESLSSVILEPPLLTALVAEGEGRQKRRKVPLAQIPERVRQAVLAIEDRRFYDHPGVDPIGIAGALLTNWRGEKAYTSGGSTITQQLVKNLLLSPEKSYTRKVKEQFMSVIVETKLTKDEILELYLNEIYLGQRGSFAIHGFAEAARMFFGKDVSNLSLSEAATLAGTIQAPPALSPFRVPEKAKARRDVVLRTMAEVGYISHDAAFRAQQEPLTTGRARARSRGAVFRRLRRAAARLEIDRRPPLFRRCAHDARFALAARRAGRGEGRTGKSRRPALEAPPQGRPGAGRADRDRSAHRRDSRDGRRALLQSIAIQPRDRLSPSTRIGVQAVRVPRGVRARAGGRPHRSHAGHGRDRRADDVLLRGQGLRADELRAGV